ncbi:MAG: protease modulator HflC [Alphaproteobacteria bacterium]
MSKSLLYFITIAFIIVISNSIYIVDERKQALVFQFGEVVKAEKEPGLHFKLPLIQTISYFDKRILNLVSDEKEVIAKDRKRLIINAFAKYRIIDPRQFYTTVRDESGLRTRLNSILDPSLRQIIGEIPFSALLSDKRSEIMKKIEQQVNQQVKNFGIEVIDVRILRADLPKENSNAVYKRMQTDRDKEAKEFRAEGAEEAQRIKSRADKDRKVLIAEAQKQAEITRGEGDAISSKIFADTFNQDPEFFAFYRSLQAYKQVFDKSNTKLVISPTNDFLKFFDNNK